MAITTKRTDHQTARIYAALKVAFPELSDEETEVVYRYNRYSIRVRVVADCFGGRSLAEREAMVNRVLARIEPEDNKDISMLMMLSPQESVSPDLMNLEFDDPGRSRL